MMTFPTNHHSSTVYITFQILNECGKPKCHRLTMTISDGLSHWVLGGAITLIGVFFQKIIARFMVDSRGYEWNMNYTLW